MSEQPLQVSLEAIAHRPHQFILTFNSSQYPDPVMLNPETNVIFNDWVRRLSHVLMGRSDSARQLAPQELLRSVGTWLWQALLPDNVPREAREALVHTLRTGLTPLLLTLPDTLAWLPWELLCDPQQPIDQGFLACRRPLMRFHSSTTPRSPIAPPLRVLLLISSPPDLREDSRVDVESERAAVEQATRHEREAGFLHLLIEDIVTPKRVQQALVSFNPHIVHYIGHGEYNKETGGKLLWEDEQGKALPLSAARLATLLRPHHLSAVILHACETGKREARTDVLSVAGTLVKEGLPAVLAQQASFSYASSQYASKVWYTALMEGKGYAEALLEVRRILFLENYPDWAVPVLYGGTASLAPVLEAAPATPGPPDPRLTIQGAAADLPTPIGVFVGRHRELHALRLMLESSPGRGPSIALILGPGGIGKSTLAAQAVTRYGGEYKATLTLSCLSYRSVELFLQHIGEFLKRQDASRFLEQILPDPKLSIEAKIEEAVVAFNQAGPFLLMVENLESAQHDDHAMRDESLLYLLQKLLTHLRGGRVLITGRYEVKGLHPSRKSAKHLLWLYLEDLSPYETNQLVMRHSSLARLGEVVREKIIHEFGGLPYVYDLLSSKAASQDLDLLIHDMQMRITQEHKRRTAEQWREVHRQVVEFAALEETVKHLLEPSRVLLAQLSVLPQSFPLAAIEEGLGATHAEWQPLLDCSLLHYDPLEHTYRLHSVTKQFAESLLNEQDRKQIQIQLAVWYQHYAEHQSYPLVDFLESHRLFRSAGSVQQAGELAMHLAENLIRLGLYPLARDLCTTTLHDIGKSDERLVAAALNKLGSLAMLQGNYPEAQRLYKKSLEISEWLGDQDGRADSLLGLGNIAKEQGAYLEARQFFQESLETVESLGDQSERFGALFNLGDVALSQGDYVEARRLNRESLEILELLDNVSEQTISHYRAMILHQLGLIAWNQGDYQEAWQLFQQSLEIFERLGDQSGRANNLYHLGILAMFHGNHPEAQRLYQESLEIFELQGDQIKRANALGQLGLIARRQGDYEGASQFCQQVLEIKERLGDQNGQALSLHQLGLIARERGDYQRALQFCQQSLEISKRLGNQSEQAGALHELGNIASLQRNHQEAQRLYQKSLEIAERIGNKSVQAHSLHGLGIIAQEQGDYPEARRLYQQSWEIFSQMGDQSGLASSLFQLGSVARQQRDYEAAMAYIVQAYILLNVLSSPSRDTVKRVVVEIARQMDEESFVLLRQGTRDDLPQVENQVVKATTLVILADIHESVGHWWRAVELHEQALPLLREVRDWPGEASFNKLASLYGRIGRPRRALALYKQALRLARKRKDRAEEAKVLSNIASIYQITGRPQHALKLYEQVLPIRRELKDRAGEAVTLHNMAWLYQAQRHYSEAQAMFEQSVALSHLLSEPADEAMALFGLAALLYQRLNRREEAIVALERFVTLLEEDGLSQDTAGNTVQMAQELLHMIRVPQEGGSFEVAFEGELALPLHLIRRLITKTIAVMTSHKSRHAEWLETIAGELQRMQQEGAEWPGIVDFFTCLLDILDGRPTTLPDKHPFASALRSITDEIRKADEEARVSSQPFVAEIIAALALEPTDEKRSAVRENLVKTRIEIQEGKRNMYHKEIPKAIAFFDAVIGLLDAQGDPTGLGTSLTGLYTQWWQQIILHLPPQQERLSIPADY